MAKPGYSVVHSWFSTPAAALRFSDVPATVLALLGCRIPENFDGRVLTEILTDDVTLHERTAATGPPDDGAGPPAADFTDEDQAAVQQRLKGLGYL